MPGCATRPPTGCSWPPCPGWYRAALFEIVGLAFAVGLTALVRWLMHQHPVIGERILSERAGVLDDERRLALLHCVLCHHGPTSAPGGRFASAEALALYRINALDASVKGAFEQGL